MQLCISYIKVVYFRASSTASFIAEFISDVDAIIKVSSAGLGSSSSSFLVEVIADCVAIWHSVSLQLIKFFVSILKIGIGKSQQFY